MTTNPWIPLFLTTENFIPAKMPEPLAEQYLQKATQAIASAKNEITYGETISELLLSNEGGLKECHRSLATIGVWHFECAVELFNKAIRNFERAKKRGLSRTEQKEIESQIKECKRQIIEVNKQKDISDDLLNSI